MPGWTLPDTDCWGRNGVNKCRFCEIQQTQQTYIRWLEEKLIEKDKKIFSLLQSGGNIVYPNPYSVFVYMREYFGTHGKIPLTDELLSVFPNLGQEEIEIADEEFGKFSWEGCKMTDAYEVLVYMRTYYKAYRKTLDISDLVAAFPELNIVEIHKGEQMFRDWLSDVSA